MGLDGLLDSNTIIDFVGGNLPEDSSQFLSEGKFCASQISLIEVLGYPMEKSAEEKFRNFFNRIQIISIDSQVIDVSIQLRKSKRIKLGDAIIGATSQVLTIPLVTRNIADFKGLPVFSLSTHLI